MFAADDDQVSVGDEADSASTLVVGSVQNDGAGDGDSDSGAGDDHLNVVEFARLERVRVAIGGDGGAGLSAAVSDFGGQLGWNDDAGCASEDFGDSVGEVGCGAVVDFGFVVDKPIGE